MYGPNGRDTMADKALDPTVPVYLRMPRSSSESLNEIAKMLGVKPSLVANAIFRFVMYPDWFIDWDAHVRALRSVVDRETENRCLADFSISDWLERRPVYDKLEQMGLIEDFDFSSSVNKTRRIICTFRVSDAGRVIAEIFKETGIADTIKSDEFEKPSSGAKQIPSAVGSAFEQTQAESDSRSQ
jgi:hypothetical protein